MPVNYELNIDHQVIEIAAWDVVTLGDLDDCQEELATLPADLGKTIAYLDFGQVTDMVICPLGALQIARSFEKIMDCGLRGCVVYAPNDACHETARMLISTFASVCGDLPEGYRLTRSPLAIRDVRSFVHLRDEPARLVA
jgi:hypothetical protein